MTMQTKRHDTNQNYITEVAHKYYILFYTFIRSVIGRNIPKKET